MRNPTITLVMKGTRNVLFIDRITLAKTAREVRLVKVAKHHDDVPRVDDTQIEYILERIVRH